MGKEYLSNLKISNPCGRACGEETVLETIAPIFESLGISTPEFGGMGSITMGYKVNYGAMESYTRATEDTISFGVFAISSGKLGTNDIMDENGGVTQGVIAQDLSKYKHSLFELKISGFETDEQKNAKLCFGVYVIATDEDGKKISFLQEGDPAEGQKYYFASYNDLVTTSPKE